jgi:UPF0755 protein
MKKKKIITGILLFILLVACFFAWKVFSPSVSTPGGEFFYIRTGATYAEVKQELVSKKFLPGSAWFDMVSKILRYKNIRPGRYKINNGMSLFKLVRLLKNGKQSPISIVITKIRTKEDLARKIGSQFECDSTQMIHFLNNADSLREYDLDSNIVMTAVMPYTYNMNWNTTPKKVFQNFFTAYKNFWTTERRQKAGNLNLSPTQVSILASIVDEETNLKSDRPNIASVYLNRMKKGMPLQADPTIKFALRDFKLKRIYDTHLAVRSPYNTYLNTGLPPGPICTPSVETIDAVLDAPQTNYLYFVASSNFDGSSVFTSDYKEHMKYAKAYQQAMNKRDTANKK